MFYCKLPMVFSFRKKKAKSTFTKNKGGSDP